MLFTHATVMLLYVKNMQNFKKSRRKKRLLLDNEMKQASTNKSSQLDYRFIEPSGGQADNLTHKAYEELDCVILVPNPFPHTQTHTR